MPSWCFYHSRILQIQAPVEWTQTKIYLGIVFVRVGKQIDLGLEHSLCYESHGNWIKYNNLLSCSTLLQNFVFWTTVPLWVGELPSEMWDEKEGKVIVIASAIISNSTFNSGLRTGTKRFELSVDWCNGCWCHKKSCSPLSMCIPSNCRQYLWMQRWVTVEWEGKRREGPRILR